MRPLECILFRSVLCATALALSTPVLAVDDGTREAPPSEDLDEGVTYSGIGLSRMNVDDIALNSNNTLIIDSPINLNAAIGFRIPTVPVFSVELDLMITAIPGQIQRRSCSAVGGGGGLPPPLGGGGGGSTNCSESDEGDFGVNFGAGAYAVLRSPGRFYGMAKYGYRYLSTNIQEFPRERTGNAYGAGFGYRWNPRKNSGAEIFYSRLAEEMDAIGFNISYGFGGRD